MRREATKPYDWAEDEKLFPPRLIDILENSNSPRPFDWPTPEIDRILWPIWYDKRIGKIIADEEKERQNGRDHGGSQLSDEGC